MERAASNAGIAASIVGKERRSYKYILTYFFDVPKGKMLLHNVSTFRIHFYSRQKIDHYAEDGGLKAVWLLNSFYHDSLRS